MNDYITGSYIIYNTLFIAILEYTLIYKMFALKQCAVLFHQQPHTSHPPQKRHLWGGGSYGSFLAMVASIFSCSFGVSMGKGEFSFFLLHHLDPPAIIFKLIDKVLIIHIFQNF